MIKIVRNEQGNCINFEGSSNPTYWNACLSGEVDSEDANTVNVINDVITSETGSTEYEFYKIPFTDFSDKAETRDKPRRTRANCSTAPNFKAKSVSCGEIKKSITKPTKAPMVLAMSASPNAKSPLPDLAKGYPLMLVTIDAGLPGIFINIAGIAPPAIPPTKTPISIPNDEELSR